MRRVAFSQFLRWPNPAQNAACGSPLKLQRADECFKIAVGAYLTSFTGDFSKKRNIFEAALHGVTWGMDRTLTLRQFSMEEPSGHFLSVTGLGRAHWGRKLSKVERMRPWGKMGQSGHVVGILMMNCSADGAYTLHLTLTYFALA